ncbi:MAG: ChaN family lipoprotein [Bacteroidota bacterium]|nr:ChaN family lipoprotein [Bacteroidota bacterium]
MKANLIISICLLFCCIITTTAQKSFTEEQKYLRLNAAQPTDYIIQKFSNYDLVLLGENHAIKENLDFVAELIPHLYKAGVYNLCMEFGAAEMQSRLDSLINAPRYDEQIAREMIYFYNVGWAYKEYADIYKAAWTFNKQLPSNARKFRIVNLSYQYDWSKYSSDQTPETMQKVFHKGVPDKFRAERIESEIISKHEKALIFVGSVHAFTKFKMGVPYSTTVLSMNSDDFRYKHDFIYYDDGFLGNRLLRKYPDKTFNILLHCALFSIPGEKTSDVSPANGQIEQIMKLMNYKPMGFDLGNSPIGKLHDSSTYSQGYTNFTIGQMFDGYIFLKPFDQMTGCTVDSLFFNNRKWEDVQIQIPDPNWFAPKSMQEFKDKIKRYVIMRQRYKDVIDPTMPKTNSGRLIRLSNFASRYVQPRNIDVWLPEDYDESKRYSVLYMHDGQMLFDSTITWNHQAWEADKCLKILMERKQVKECIIVGIWNNGKLRHSEYLPGKAIQYLPTAVKDSLLNETLSGKPQADNYLRFIVEELKPFIDSTFATRPGQQDTYIAGSSMGGLISMYAMCEYPQVFGGAACMSTHWIGDFNVKNEAFPRAFAQYMQNHLPSPKNHKFYFDCGTMGLDSHYPVHQKKADNIMKQKGYDNSNWITRKFDGADHSEISWSKRLDIPLLFLLKK